MGYMKSQSTGGGSRRSTKAASGFVGEQWLTINLLGDLETTALFERLSGDAQRRVLRPLMTSASSQIAEALRDAAPEESGLLKRAMGTSILKTYGGTLFVTAGVRRGFRRSVSVARTGRWRIRGWRASASADQSTIRNPVRYLHLVTGGRQAVAPVTAKVLYSAQTGTFFGRHARAVAPNPFVERTFASAGPAAVARITQEAADRIVQEAGRGNSS